jgi:hypothetical protein
MRYEFHPDALEELRQAAEYYATRETGLELRFIDSIEETIGVASNFLASPGLRGIISINECERDNR